MDLRKLRNSLLLHEVCVRYVCEAVQYTVGTEMNGDFQGAQVCVKTEGITGCGPGRGREHRGRSPFIQAGTSILEMMIFGKSGKVIGGVRWVEELGKDFPR